MNKAVTVRDQFRQMLEKDRLDNRQFAELSELMADMESGRRQWQLLPLAMAASMALLISAWFVYSFKQAPEVDSGLASRIAEEVITNHIHLHELDIETASMTQLGQFLDRLDFVPIASTWLDQTPLELQGGRYCTLQGAIATQLMFDTPRGEIVTHYQAAYDRERFGDLPDIGRGQQPLVLEKHGVEVRIWVEQGLVMAKARHAPEPQ